MDSNNIVMTGKMTASKREAIINTRRETMLRRKSQTPKVFELKVDKSHLSKKTQADLASMFREAKWIYNAMLGTGGYGGIVDYDTRKNVVSVMNKDKEFEERPIAVLSSQMKQSMRDRILKSIHTLSALKRKGFKVGRLKFKSDVQSIPLKKFGVTYDISGKYVRIQNIKQRLKVSGIDQFPKDANFDIANAVIIRKHGDYYVKVSVFIMNKPVVARPDKPDVGVDFGLKTQLTLSDGVKIEFKFPDNSRTRTLQRALARKTKGSANWFNTKQRLEKAYDIDNHRRADAGNKTLSYLSQNYNRVAVQDDCIKGWQAGRHGKAIHATAIGEIKRRLLQSPRTVKVDRFFASTKTCRVCEHENIIGLDERTFHCEKCGHTEDRDVHSARNMMIKAIIVPGESRDFKPAEIATYTPDALLVECKLRSVSQEAPSGREG